jgi:hypothetical protein
MQSELEVLIELEFSERGFTLPATEPHKSILAYVLSTCIEKKDLSATSVSRKEVSEHLRGRYTEEDVAKAVSRLEDSGLLYSLWETKKGEGNTLRIYLCLLPRMLGDKYLDKHPEITGVKR